MAVIDGGAIVFGAVTTPPTKGTTVSDRVQYYQNGDMIVARYKYHQTDAGTAGSGDYLYTLPNGLQFNTNFVQTYTGSIANLDQEELPKCLVGYGHFSISDNFRGVARLYAYSATQFRVGIRALGVSPSLNVHGSGFFNLGGAIGFRLQIEAPVSSFTVTSPDVAFADGGAITVGATTTAPTKGTVVHDKVMYGRNGEFLHAFYQLETSAGGSAGSGDYLYSLPAGLSFGSTVKRYSGSAANLNDQELQAACIGFGHLVVAGGFRGFAWAFAYNDTQFRLGGFIFNSSLDVQSSTYYNFASACGVGIKITVPISGWSPVAPDTLAAEAGAITIDAVTTAPTKGTVVLDKVIVARNGERLIANYQYEQSSGGTAGSGDYLFQLPNGLQFDVSVVDTYDGVSLNAGEPAISKAVVGYGHVSANGTHGHVTLVAYDATHFRAIALSVFNTYSPIDSGFYKLDEATLGFGFILEAPVIGFESTVPEQTEDPEENILSGDAGATLAAWTTDGGASKNNNDITFPKQASGVAASAISYLFTIDRFVLNKPHRFTGILTPKVLNYPHTDVKWFVENRTTGERITHIMTFDGHEDQGGQDESSLLEPKEFNIVFHPKSETDQFVVGFENFTNNQEGCTFTVSNQGVFIVL